MSSRYTPVHTPLTETISGMALLFTCVLPVAFLLELIAPGAYVLLSIGIAASPLGGAIGLYLSIAHCRRVVGPPPSAVMAVVLGAVPLALSLVAMSSWAFE